MEDKSPHRMTINPEFRIGEIVYLVTDPMQEEYIITAYRVEWGNIYYLLSHGRNEEIQCQSFEFQREKIIK